MISNSDLDELKRMATNFYDSDKARINRILKGIADLTKENTALKEENIRLRAQVSG
jgi:cell division protein FtsB